ncbi:MAG TPA: nucleoside-diphosphate sugar epimerase/dehydratase [Sphingomicrobium sp.]|nr:nucleoside-diphosphate sugar epimerase/dehydratase [Sphingomicrobium sp.]
MGGDALQSQVLRLVALPRAARKSLVLTLDCGVCLAAVPIAFWLRLGEWELRTPRVIIFAGIALAAWVIVSLATRTYRSVTRFAGQHTLLALMRSCMLMSFALAIILLTLRINSMPRTLSVIHPLVFFLGLAGERLLLSHLIVDALRGLRRIPIRKQVLIYGAGVSGQQLAASIRQDPSLYVVGFIDRNESLRDNILEGKRIWHTGDLELVLNLERIDEVFIALPTARRSVRRAIVERIHHYKGGVRVRVLPTLSQIASGRVSVSDLREVQIEELLGRDEVAPDALLMQRNITGRRVLVTGAGGSIGSELCRQIIRQRPRLIVLAEQSEHALYTIDIELREIARREGLPVEVSPELVNVADEHQCERMLSRHGVDTVFHAAAYKHVPLVESNPIAGIRNNVLSTLSAALACERCGVAKFILVSTDKAVRPTNVMGASKRVCELVVQARAAAQQETSYCSVRFGNVLGSSGSVIPRFRQQIAAGGPVTITHSEATRYFMTIPEAAQLVIQAGALAGDGEVLLLEMGDPVRIIDLARLMIELSGLSVADDDNPDGEIAIEEIGLRPGEKLIEELLIGGDCEGTAHPRIVKARESMLPWCALEAQLESLVGFLKDAAADAAIAKLRELVPEFRSPIDETSLAGADVRELQSRVVREVLGGA